MRCPGSHSKAELKPRALPPPARPVLPHLPDTWLLASSWQRTTYSFRTPGQVLSRDGVQSTDTESWLSFFTDTCCGLPASEAATNILYHSQLQGCWLSTSCLPSLLLSRDPGNLGHRVSWVWVCIPVPPLLVSSLPLSEPQFPYYKMGQCLSGYLKS